jgi:hypothetical protein
MSTVALIISIANSLAATVLAVVQLKARFEEQRTRAKLLQELGSPPER